MLTCFYKQWREKGSFKDFESEAWRLHATSLAMAVCWARHGRLPSDFNFIAGNSVFQKWLCCCNILGRCVKSREGTFYRRGWNVSSNPLGPTTSSCTLKPCEGWSQQETLSHQCPFTTGKYIHPLFSHAGSLGEISPHTEGTRATRAAVPCPEQQAGESRARLPAPSSVLLALLWLHKQHLPGSYFLVSFACFLIFRTLFCSSYTDLFCERGYHIFWLKSLIFNNLAHLLSKSIVRLGNSFN